eukprot:6006149-Alexandrium_andersonii.AAC.1
MGAGGAVPASASSDSSGGTSSAAFACDAPKHISTRLPCAQRGDGTVGHNANGRLKHPPS